MGRHVDSLLTKALSIFPDLASQDEIWKAKGASVESVGASAMVAAAQHDHIYAKRDHSFQVNQSPERGARSAPSAELRVRTTTLTIENFHKYGSLYADFLRARHQVFIQQKGWDLPQQSGMEFDQYDTPQARSIVVHDYGTVLAGIRLAPTTAQCGLHSYMLRDAQLGLLPEMPRNILHVEAPVSRFIWEATRLFITDDVPAERRPAVQKILMNAMSEAARDVGASHVIGIVPAVFKRWLLRIGMSATAVGPAMEIDGDRVQAALMSVIPKAS